MHQILLGMSFCVLAMASALETLNANQQQEKSPAEQYMALAQDYRAAQKESAMLLRNAKTDEERIHAQSKMPDADVYAKKMLEIAEKHPKGEAAFDALVWVVNTVLEKTEGRMAMERLSQGHAAHPRIGEVIRFFASGTNSAAEKLLSPVMANNPSKDIQGQACFALASNFRRRSELAARQNKPDVAADLSKKAENLFDRVMKEFGDVKQGEVTLAELAEPELFEQRFLAVGKTVPDIVEEDIHGKAFKLSGYRGKVVMLVFWGHWCEPCREMFPHEKSLVKRLADKPFALIGVNSDKDREKLKETLKTEGITWRSFWDGLEGANGAISKKWNVRGWPTIYIIDHQGVIRAKYHGAPGGEVLDKIIDSLVKEAESRN